MPVEFLSDDQARRYGHYTEISDPEQLVRYFYLDNTDRSLIEKRRTPYNQLGFAVQLGTVRFLGTFLSDLAEVPQSVVQYLAQQLEIEDSNCFTQYLHRDTTRREHALEIQEHYGYKTFGEGIEYWSLLRWLYSRAYLGYFEDKYWKHTKEFEATKRIYLMLKREGIEADNGYDAIAKSLESVLKYGKELEKEKTDTNPLDSLLTYY